MAPGFVKSLKHAWNAFRNKDEDEGTFRPLGPSYAVNPSRPRISRTNERSIINSIYNRIAIDVAAIDVRHVRLDDEGRYLETIKSGLNDCLTYSANIDQTGRALRQDIAHSLFDHGSIAVVAVDTTEDPNQTGSFDINSLRCGPVVQWFPRHVTVELYDDREGRKKEINFPKEVVAVIENPLYSVMNETNSTLARLIRKLNLLDAADEQASSGKLDIIIQLPYVVKSDARRAQAEQRRKDIEMQLTGSTYGIAYTDGTEKITQLNRAAENNLLEQIVDLRAQLYGQLGITKDVIDGIADELVMINYHNRTIEPVLSAIVDSMFRTFVTKHARTQKQALMFFRDPFKLIPVTELAEVADKFLRNEILSPNDFLSILGRRPSKDPKADELRNRNLNAEGAAPEQPTDKPEVPTNKEQEEKVISK